MELTENYWFTARPVDGRLGREAGMARSRPNNMDRNPGFFVDKWFRLALRNFIRSYHAYQPVRFEGKLLQPGRRDFEHRWKLIRREAVDCGARTVLDLGCSEGYFTQRAARELGCFSLGIDANIQRLTVAQNINTLQRHELTGFMYGHINIDSLACLPRFDMVLFLSVLHHFLKEHGVDHCIEILRVVRTKTNKLMVFDMGYKKKILEPWAKSRRIVGEEPSAWIAEILRLAGFSQVDLIGHSSANKGRAARAMFRALP